MSIHLRVRVGAESYALPVLSVREVAKLGEIAPLPGAPGMVVGVRNVHGQVMPVLDLAGLLGVARDGQPERVVIAEEDGLSAGLAVDAVIGVEDITEAAEEVKSPHLSGAALIDGALV